MPMPHPPISPKNGASAHPIPPISPPSRHPQDHRPRQRLPNRVTKLPACFRSSVICCHALSIDVNGARHALTASIQLDPWSGPPHKRQLPRSVWEKSPPIPISIPSHRNAPHQSPGKSRNLSRDATSRKVSHLPTPPRRHPPLAASSRRRDLPARQPPRLSDRII
jgi:hypothetical protein